MKYSNNNMTFVDIANTLKMTESAVKRRYYKARDSFKEFRLSKERRCK